MAELVQMTPIVPVSDLDAAITFFTDVLGFEPRQRAVGNARLVRDRVAVRLIRGGPDRDPHDPRCQQACYIDVVGLDALYAELEPALSRLPPERVRAPFDRPYGQREFHVIDEESLLIFFGEPIPTTTPTG